MFGSVHSLSHVWLFATPWTAACQASLSITISRNLLKLMSTESVMLSNHFILCHPLLLPPSIFLSIWVFSSESFLHKRRPENWSFSFSISPSNEYRFHLGWTGLISSQSKGLSRVFSNITVLKPQFFSAHWLWIGQTWANFLANPIPLSCRNVTKLYPLEDEKKINHLCSPKITSISGISLTATCSFLSF